MKASIIKRTCKLLLEYGGRDFSLENGVEGRERLLAKILAGVNQKWEEHFKNKKSQVKVIKAGNRKLI